MRTLKVAFVDFWQGIDIDQFILMRAMRDLYNVELTDVDSADYVFYSVFGESHWSVPADKIKVFYTGENICPDFNACDYAFGFEWLDYGDRYMRLPNYYCTSRFLKTTLLMEENQKKSFLISDSLSDKTEFCSFVVSNSDANPIRQQMFEMLSNYKKVDSGGRFMNNIGGPVVDKYSFDRKHKFSITVENSSHPGYTTEKIVEAFAAKCIPIYWGDPNITKVFNPKSFINVMDYSSIEAVVEEVKRIDEDSDAYYAMLAETPYIETQQMYEHQYSKLKVFLTHIIEQPIGCAYRYNREFWGRKYIARQTELLAKSQRGMKDFLKERFLK